MARKGLNEEFQFHRDIFDFIDKLDGQLSLVNLNCHRPAPKKKKKKQEKMNSQQNFILKIKFFYVLNLFLSI